MIPPAAWYPDPAHSGQLRWWDGRGWTHETSAPVVAEYQPMAYFVTAEQTTDYDDPPGNPVTIWVWLPAALPLLLATILVLRLNSSGLIYLGPLGLYVTIALFDRRALVSRGFEDAPNQWWILIPPVYFLIRAAKTTAASYPPFIGWIVTMVVAAVLLANSMLDLGLLPSVSSATESTAPAGLTPPYTEEQLDFMLTPDGMAEQIKSELGLSFDTFSCVPLASTEVSAATTCSGTYVGTTLEIDVQVAPRVATADPFFIVATRTSLTQ